MAIKKRRTKQETKKTKVYVEHACFICGKVSDTAKETLTHVERMHGYEIPARPVGRTRPKDDHYDYVADRKKKHELEHYGCPSCWFHCPQDNLDNLNAHFLDEHKFINLDMSKNHGHHTRRSSTATTTNGPSSDESAEKPITYGADTKAAVKDISIKLDELIDTLKNLFA